MCGGIVQKDRKIRLLNYVGFFCTLDILIFSGFATSRPIGLVKQNENDGVTQTSERTLLLI